MCIRTRMHVFMSMGLGASTLRMLKSTDATIFGTHNAIRGKSKIVFKQRTPNKSFHCHHVIIRLPIISRHFKTYNMFPCIIFNETDEISQNFLPLWRNDNEQWDFTRWMNENKKKLYRLVLYSVWPMENNISGAVVNCPDIFFVVYSEQRSIS